MNSRPRTKFSSAHVLAMLALFVAIGGGAYATVKNNSVGTKKIKNNAVKSSKIADNAVKNSELADASVGTLELQDGSVTTPKIADNAVTGAKADESTFGEVPSALNATNATNATEAAHAADADHADNADDALDTNTVNGVTVQGFRYNVDAPAGNVTLFSLGGVTLTASCPAANDVNLIAGNGSNDASIHSYSVDGAGTIENVVTDSEWDAADADKNLAPDDDNNESFTFQYSRPAIGLTSSTAVTAVFQMDSDVVAGSDCLITGHVMRSSSGGLIIIG